MPAPGSPQKQLDGFLAKYLPEIGAQARACLKIMRARIPGAIQLVYDNYNALVIGFGPSERPSEAVFSVVLFPRWVSICFLQGARVPDPDKLLTGSGNQVRFLRLASASDLNRPDVRELMATAMETANVPFDPSVKSRLIIRSISAKQRPRRPA